MFLCPKCGEDTSRSTAVHVCGETMVNGIKIQSSTISHPYTSSQITEMAREYDKIDVQVEREHINDIDWTNQDTSIETMRRFSARLGMRESSDEAQMLAFIKNISSHNFNSSGCSMKCLEKIVQTAKNILDDIRSLHSGVK